MYFSRKQRHEFSITGFIPAITCIVLYALAVIFVGPKAGIAVAGVFFILYSGFSIWIFSRTGNLSYIAAALFQFFFGLFFLTHPKLSVIWSVDSKISALILLMCVASTIWLFYLFFKKRAKWKGREVFELASVSTEPQPDGFTDRPRPAGRTDYTRSELSSFAKFMSSHLIAMPYFENERVVFVPVKMDDSFSYLFSPEKFRQKRSWIAFDFHGNITVNISKIDYLGYKEELSFDLLCENMGILFIRFMEYYRKGEADRILYELDEVGLGLTS
jgi:hypothetical protein